MLDFLDIYKKLDFLSEYLRVQYTNFIIKYFHKVETKITLEEIFTRLEDDEPIEYIFNLAEFGEFNLYVDRRVLIPRQETLALTKKACEYISNDFYVKNVFDIGTGSGCIAIYLASNIERPDIQYYAVDISRDALDVAEMNIKRYDLNDKIRLINSDFRNINFDNFPDSVIVANLPYVPSTRKLLDSVYIYEPHIALFGGENGDELINDLLDKIKKSKTVKKTFLEIDHGNILIV